MKTCELTGHFFLNTEPACCVECSYVLSKYDLIRTKGNGRVFVVGTMTVKERLEFDKALQRGKMTKLETIMQQAFQRIGIDTGRTSST